MNWSYQKFTMSFAVFFISSALFCFVQSKSLHMIYWGKFCKSISTGPTKSFANIVTLSRCAKHCVDNLELCRAFSFVDQICDVYELLSTKIFSLCSDGMGPNKEARFFARYNMNEEIKKLDNLALFNPAVISANLAANFSTQDQICFSFPDGKMATDGILKYDIDVFQQKDCGKYASLYSPNPWIKVDLQQEYSVIEVIVYNPGNGQEELLHDIEIRIGMVDIGDVPDSDRSPFTENALCASAMNKSLPSGPNVFPCSKDTTGRIVTVQIVKPCQNSCKYPYNKIALVELEVWGFRPKIEINRAFLKPTRMTSQFSNYASNFAVDGYKSLTPVENGRPVSTSSLGKDPEERPWFQVDLLDAFKIDKIIVYTVDISQPAIMHDLEIQIGLEDLANASSKKPLYYSMTRRDCRHFNDKIFPIGRTEITCRREQFGRYVSLQITQNCSLSVCSTYTNRIVLSEIEVIGDVLKSYSTPINISFRKKAAQSSIAENAIASLAVDGNLRNSFLDQNSQPQCTLTEKNDEFPWWRVDLEGEYLVQRISILNREDIEKVHLHDFLIEVGYYDLEEFPANLIFRKNGMCVAVNGTVESGWQHFTCFRRTRGNFVNIQMVKNCLLPECTDKSTNILSLCEVLVFGSPIPRWKTDKHELVYVSDALQSTVAGPENGVHLTTDGFTNIEPLDTVVPVCSSTSIQPNEDVYPWWRIDMFHERIVHEVVVYNRLEKEKRLHDFEIRVGMEDIANIPLNTLFYMNDLCADAKDVYILPGALTYLCPSPLFGRYVSIQIVKQCTMEFCSTKTANVLSLCEVFVWGIKTPIGSPVKLQNEAIFRPTMQSSIWKNANSSLAVDGILGSVVWTGAEYKCTQTDPNLDSLYPWWRVDMIRSVEVHKVDINNAGADGTKILHDVDIRIGDEDIAHFPPNVIFLQNKLCYSVENIMNPGREIYTCFQKPIGRFLSIQMTRLCDYEECHQLIKKPVNILSLCEVSVWARIPDEKPSIEITNIAVDKFAIQSSTTSSSHLAVNCFEQASNSSWNIEHSCSMTVSEYYPWWMMDLGSIYVVYHVLIAHPEQIHNETYAPRIAVRVGNWNIALGKRASEFTLNSVCGEIRKPGTKGQPRKIYCRSPVKGQHASFQILPSCDDQGLCPLVKSQLVMCKVEIYGNLHLPY